MNIGRNNKIIYTGGSLVMKHAYLIMAHGEWDLLNNLLKALDYPNNDIYLHIDKKSIVNKDTIIFPKFSKIIMIKRMNVNWGGDSQIKCILRMLSIASKNNYCYYHLLSGVDIPLETQESIHAFFKNNKGKNFLSFDNKDNYVDVRLKEYHFLQNFIGRNNGHLVALLYYIENFFIGFQKKIGVNRIKDLNITFYKGGGWFSITDDLVKLLLHNRRTIKRYFYHSLCPDEMFIQTIANNSSLASTIVDDDLRYIDWNRGTPYIFRKEDYDTLCTSGKLFARKFSSQVDKEIIASLYERLNVNQ